MKAKNSFRQRIRYAFDNTMSKGTPALIIWLGVLSLLLIVVAGIILIVLNIKPADSDAHLTFIEGTWNSLMRTLDPGTMGGDVGWGFRITMLVVTIGGIFIVSTLIGVISSGIENKIDELKKGKSHVLESGHTLILGWNSKVFTILSELSIANQNQKKPRVVILAEKDKVEMQDEIKSRLDNLNNTKVICRNGNPNDINELDIVNPNGAKSIIILSPDEDVQADDSQVIKTILAITNNPNRKIEPYHIVAEVKEERNLEVAKMVGGDEVELLLKDDIIARIMVQTCRQSGLSVVYQELMDFEGAEIYFNEEKELVGKTFGESLAIYKDSSVIGMQMKDGSVTLNPSMDTIYEDGSKVIAITEDDDTLIISKDSKREVTEELIKSRKTKKDKLEKTLILGWNYRGTTIIKEMNNYVKRGSSIKVIAFTDTSETEVNKIKKKFSNLSISYQKDDSTDSKIIRAAKVTEYDHIIVLSYSDDLEKQKADSKTLVTLLHLRQISEETGKDLNIVSEMLDIRNRELAEVTKADDFIVSDKLISLLISQISENKKLMRVFEDIFDADGSEIYLKPAGEYVEVDKSVNFYTVLESAKRKNEVAFGYRISKDAHDVKKCYGIKVNPIKSDYITFSQCDKIIILAEN
ncbi:MAG: NAD-binding protein [Ignavibacteriales bacterium]|nr:NAD-binding protein [Ignavibacteriales bacterium]